MMALILAIFWKSSFHFPLEPIIWSVCNSSHLEFNIYSMFSILGSQNSSLTPAHTSLLCQTLTSALLAFPTLMEQLFLITDWQNKSQKIGVSRKGTFHVSLCCCYETGRLSLFDLFLPEDVPFYMLPQYESVYLRYSRVSKTRQLKCSWMVTLDFWEPVSPKALLAPTAPHSHTSHGFRNAPKPRTVEVGRPTTGDHLVQNFSPTGPRRAQDYQIITSQYLFHRLYQVLYYHQNLMKQGIRPAGGFVIHSADTRPAHISHRDQGLCMAGSFQLSESLIYFFLIWCSELKISYSILACNISLSVFMWWFLTIMQNTEEISYLCVVSTILLFC